MPLPQHRLRRLLPMRHVVRVARSTAARRVQVVAVGQVAAQAVLPLGLLLADLQQRRQKPGEAEATYKQLINNHPEDPRPLVALALLQRDGILALLGHRIF